MPLCSVFPARMHTPPLLGPLATALLPLPVPKPSHFPPREENYLARSAHLKPSYVVESKLPLWFVHSDIQLWTTSPDEHIDEAVLGFKEDVVVLETCTHTRNAAKIFTGDAAQAQKRMNVIFRSRCVLHLDVGKCGRLQNGKSIDSW